MKTRAAWVLALVLVFAAVPAFGKEDEAKKDLEKLQGEWVIVSAERDGQPAPKEETASLKRTVKGDEYTVTRNGETIGKGKYRMDPTKKPKSIDAITKSEDGEEITLQGIYEFEGETYKVCFAMPGHPRPTDFKTSENSGRTLTVSKRAGAK